MEYVWTENYFPKDQSEYERWINIREWFEQANLWAKPIVRHDFDDSSEFDGNAYGKGGLVLYMLRHQIGDDAFYRGLKHYLEVNRGKNVVTADLVKAIEEETHTNVDQFFTQWVYGAGAPKFDLSYAYDDAKASDCVEGKADTKSGRPGGTVPRTDRRRNHHSTGSKGISDYGIESRRSVCAAGGQRADDGAV